MKILSIIALVVFSVSLGWLVCDWMWKRKIRLWDRGMREACKTLFDQTLESTPAEYISRVYFAACHLAIRMFAKRILK